jgi:CDP-glycerol glycerophosphotransferase (TagB/SpsB family)
MEMVKDSIRPIKNLILNAWFFLISLVPKQKNLVLFGSWFGQKYADNTKFIYEYMLKNCPDYEIYWMTKNKKIYFEMKEKGLPVYMAKSLKGMLVQVRTKYFFATLGYEDFNQFLWGGSYLINCWHGIPLKKIGFDTLIKDSSEYKIALKNKEIYSKYTKQVIISTSPFVTECYKSSFLIQHDVVELGQARNDMFYNALYRKNLNNNIKKMINNSRVVLYMPTHRMDGKTNMDMNIILDLVKIQNICIENDAVFLIKKHFYHTNENDHIEAYDRIFDITKENVDSQMLLYQADILVTDYSSCAFDYLLLDRSILYYCYDINDYLENDRDMYMKYLDAFAGPTTETKEELNLLLENSLKRQIDIYSERRHEIRDWLYNKSAQKEVSSSIYEYMKNLK